MWRVQVCQVWSCISKHDYNIHIQHEHEKSKSVSMSEKKDETLFKRLGNKIVPYEPSEEFKCGKCSFNATTVSNFMNHII